MILSPQELQALLDRLRWRIHALVNRGAEICDGFVPRSLDPGGPMSTCHVCGYTADVHIIRDTLNGLSALLSRASEERPQEKE